MSDGNKLFSKAHGNFGTAGAPSVDTLTELADLMRQHKAPNSERFVDIRPQTAAASVPVSRDIQAIVESRFDPDAAAVQAPNKARGLVSNFVDTPRIQGSEYYMFSKPTLGRAALVVSFLNGNTRPRLMQDEHFESASLRWRAMLDYNVIAVNWRGAAKNAGG